MGKNVIIFGIYELIYANWSLEKMIFLILAKGPTQWLDDTTLSAEAQYSINFSRSYRTFFNVWKFYKDHIESFIMLETVFYFLMLQNYINPKQAVLK